MAMTLERLSRGMVRRGHTVEVVRPRQGRGDHTDASPFRQTLIPGVPLPGYAGLRIGLPLVASLRRQWKKDRPDIVHVATEGPLGWACTRLALKMRLPVSSSYHTNFHSYTQHYGVGFVRRFMLAYLRYIHNLAACTFAPSQDLVEELRRDGFRNLHLLGRGVDTTLFYPERRDPVLRRRWGALDDSTPVALYVGRVAAEKNLPLVIRAYEAMLQTEPTLKLVIVGDGPERPAMEKKYPQIHFAGMRRSEDLAAHYASGDIFLFGSTTETFGNVVTEAMGSGLVPLAFDYAAPQRYIENGVNGFKVPLGDEKAFVEAAVDLVRHPEDWPALRAAALATAQTLSWDTIIRFFEKVLFDVVEQHAGQSKIHLATKDACEVS